MTGGTTLVEVVRERLTTGWAQNVGWFDLDPRDRADADAAAATIAADDGLLRQAADVVAILTNHLGEPKPWSAYVPPARFEQDDPDAALADRMFYVAAYAAMVPATLREHADRGIPLATTAETLADVGQHARLFRQEYSRGGVWTNDWLQAHLRSVLVGLGRLQFNVNQLSRPVAELHCLGLDLNPGELVLDTHIPGRGRLAPAEVDASIGRAREFFGEHFAEIGPVRYATCDSWLLDDQLPDLVPDSNIAAFQRRWRLFEGGREADDSALRFIFHSPCLERCALPRDTRLQRAVLDHLADGGHIYQRYGILELP